MVSRVQAYNGDPGAESLEIRKFLSIFIQKRGQKRWLGTVVGRATDLWSIGHKFDSQSCTAGLVLGWVTVCRWVNRLGT